MSADAALLRERALGYGLPENCSLAGLLRHIEGNQAAVVGAKDSSIEILREQLEEAVAMLRDVVAADEEYGGPPGPDADVRDDFADYREAIEKIREDRLDAFLEKQARIAELRARRDL